jgi:ATP-dependent RNA helicase DDX56/DBP9
VPTAELVRQVCDVAAGLVKFSRRVVSVYGVSAETPLASQVPRLRECPRLLVATPGTLAAHLKNGTVSLLQLKMLAVDEADLLLSYGFEKDMQLIAKRLPPVYQALLLSATLDGSVQSLNALLLHDPAIVRLEDDLGAPSTADASALATDATDATADKRQLREFAAHCKTNDKYLICYALIKLGILPGKTLIFVNTVDKCFRVKLLLERFGLNAAVLNADLPINSRQSVISQFNRDLFDILIATDESVADVGTSVAQQQQTRKKSKKEGDDNDEEEEVVDDDDDDDNEAEEVQVDEEDVNEEDDDNNDDDQVDADDDDDDDVGVQQTSSKKKRKRVTNEFSAARGVDFVGVANVINFELPRSVSAYLHRVGRTARAGASGVALSLVSTELPGEMKWSVIISEARKIVGAELKPFEFRTAAIEGLRYRVDDMLSTIGRRSVAQARAVSLRMELINSQRLKAHFEDNPRELSLLKHNTPVAKREVRAHLTYLPRYLLPDPSKSEEINVNAVREQRLVLTGAERHREIRARRKYKKKTNGRKSAAPYKSKINDSAPFDDRANEIGLKHGGQLDDGDRFGKPQFRRKRLGGFD